MEDLLCKYCVFTAKSPRGLKMHMTRNHTFKCTECRFISIAKTHIGLTRHVNRMHRHKCPECSFYAKSKSGLGNHRNTHKKNTHNKNTHKKKVVSDLAKPTEIEPTKKLESFIAESVKKLVAEELNKLKESEKMTPKSDVGFESDMTFDEILESLSTSDQCDLKTKKITEIKSELVKKPLINCDQCDFVSKSLNGLKTHKRYKHPSEIKIEIKQEIKSETKPLINCDQCDFVSKSPNGLKTHKRYKHLITKISHLLKCKHCDYTTDSENSEELLNKHIKDDHYPCSVCEFIGNKKINLMTHLKSHNELRCDKCDFVSKSVRGLGTHKRYKHVEEFYRCIKCKYVSNVKTSLEMHMSIEHDIGDKQCEFCSSNVFELITFKGNFICKACHLKITGKNSRSETTMSEYLDENFGSDFCICSNTKINGETCSKYRPDKLYSSPDRILHVECDEHQHRNKYQYSCEEQRISNIYDEFPGKDYIVIRWNPDEYTMGSMIMEDRLKLLVDVMNKYSQIPIDGKILIIYMFYNKDNDVISKNIKSIFISTFEELM